MDWLYWIVIGFIAGAISGVLVGGRTARGCLPNIVVGILGAIVGGWIALQLGFESIPRLIAALIGAIVVRVILEALSPNQRR